MKEEQTKKKENEHSAQIEIFTNEILEIKKWVAECVDTSITLNDEFLKITEDAENKREFTLLWKGNELNIISQEKRKEDGKLCTY